jgi:uncharacterized membrane protein YedE/YeeE
VYTPPSLSESIAMSNLLTHPLHWYVAGPLLGLVVPTLLLLGNKPFGISSNFTDVCAMLSPRSAAFARYEGKRRDPWNLAFLAGIFVGAVAAWQFAPPRNVTLSPATVAALRQLGLTDFSGLAPREVFAWSALFTLKGFAAIVVGGFLVGFGTAYAGGCTSGHAISGLADLQPASLLAVCGFFAGGLAATYFLLPLLFS